VTFAGRGHGGRIAPERLHGPRTVAVDALPGSASCFRVRDRRCEQLGELAESSFEVVGEPLRAPRYDHSPNAPGDDDRDANAASYAAGSRGGGDCAPTVGISFYAASSA